MIRRYSELSKLQSFKERFDYLELNGQVGKETFGYDRYLNQVFYRSARWKKVRDSVIIRDNGCDLGIEGRDIHGIVIIHHMNPLRKEDIETDSDYLLNPEFLICTTIATHNAIHYGNSSSLFDISAERAANDTCPWK